jgi:leucine-rich PPR motif-containing protein, mitochondrial
MIDRGFLPAEVTYGSLIDSMCKQGQSKEVEKLLNLMVQGSIKPGFITYQNLFLGYASDGIINDVMKNLDRMKLSHVAPDHSIYAFCLKRMLISKNRKVDEAMFIHNRFKQEGIRPIWQERSWTRQLERLMIKSGVAMITSIYVT